MACLHPKWMAPATMMPVGRVEKSRHLQYRGIFVPRDLATSLFIPYPTTRPDATLVRSVMTGCSRSMYMTTFLTLASISLYGILLTSSYIYTWGRTFVYLAPMQLGEQVRASQHALFLQRHGDQAAALSLLPNILLMFFLFQAWAFLMLSLLTRPMSRRSCSTISSATRKHRM